MRRVLAALSAVLGGLAVAGPVLLPTPAVAAETYPVPRSGVYVLDGHGWGHGHGLNQWGAEAMAAAGQNVEQILDFYYPGTTKASTDQQNVRVLITADKDNDLQVQPQQGLVVRVVGTGQGWTLPQKDSHGTAIDAFRLYPSDSGVTLQALIGGGWFDFKPDGASGSTWPGDVRFEAPQPLALVLPGGAAVDYRGMLTLHRNGPGSAITVNTVSLQDYLDGVVPSEAIPGWPAAALQAQAVAARSYAVYEIQHDAQAAYDICDTTSCQVYRGVEVEASSTNAAVAATEAEIRTYQGSVIFAQFSASDGGWTAAGAQPYLDAYADKWDAVDSPHHSWTAQVTARQIEAAFPKIGTLTSMTVLSRDGHGDFGGRVLKVQLQGIASDGSTTTVDTSGDGIRFANAGSCCNQVQSSWWTVDPATYNAPVTRIAGADRMETAIKVSQGRWAASSAKAVVLARDDTFPDALAGGALAAAAQGPLLLTPSSGLDDRVASEIERVAPAGAKVYVLGNTDALSADVDTALRADGYLPVRVAGPDRFATATAIADQVTALAGTPTRVFETNGLDFPDAVTASAAAAHVHGVVLLTAGTSPAGETQRWLNEHPSVPRTAIGGPAAAADSSAQPLAGSDRYDTGRMVATQFFSDPAVVGAASGLKFPDALVAGPALGSEGDPLLLVPPTGQLPSSVRDYLRSVSTSLTGIRVYGGPTTVSDQVAQELGNP